jgi:hypothetical protein
MRAHWDVHAENYTVCAVNRAGFWRVLQEPSRLLPAWPKATEKSGIALAGALGLLIHHMWYGSCYGHEQKDEVRAQRRHSRLGQR